MYSHTPETLAIRNAPFLATPNTVPETLSPGELAAGKVSVTIRPW